MGEDTTMKFSQLVPQLTAGGTEHQVCVGSDPVVVGLSAIEEALPQTLSYIEGDKYAHHIATTVASALILPLNAKLQAQAQARGIAWVAVKEPRPFLAQAIHYFYRPYTPEPGIAPSATVHPSAHIGPGVTIGANGVIGPGVTIGAGVCIYPNVVIYGGAVIGDRTILHANCVIHERSEIGPDCVIHSGAAIGSEGFGFVPVAEGWLKMPQSGRVVLGAGVEIGCNAAVDRPALGTTHIDHDTKIDNLVQVAHGSKIGQHCAIAAQVGMAGGVKLGHRVILAGQVGIVDHVEMGDGAIATAKAGVHGTVPPGAIVTGIPAIPHKLFLKAAAVYSRLPEMYQTLRKLQKKG